MKDANPCARSVSAATQLGSASGRTHTSPDQVGLVTAPFVSYGVRKLAGPDRLLRLKLTISDSAAGEVANEPQSESS
jgi:hypothetical protein